MWASLTYSYLPSLTANIPVLTFLFPPLIQFNLKMQFTALLVPSAQKEAKGNKTSWGLGPSYLYIFLCPQMNHCEEGWPIIRLSVPTRLEGMTPMESYLNILKSSFHYLTSNPHQQEKLCSLGWHVEHARLPLSL